MMMMMMRMMLLLLSKVQIFLRFLIASTINHPFVLFLPGDAIAFQCGHDELLP